MPLSPVSPPPYAYRCTDRSILVGPFRRYWVPVFDWVVPAWMPANFVTLGASFFMWVMLALTVPSAGLSPTAAALAFALLIQLYVVYDHVDGMQAKKTGTSSALGEYLDHALDVYHGAIATLAVFALLGFEPRWLVLIMLWCGHLGFAATLVEEKERGELCFGAVGSLEGVFLFTVFFLTWPIPAVQAWWLAPLVGGLPAFSLLMLAGAAGSIIAAIDCVRRMGRVPLRFAVFTVASLLLAAWLTRATLPFWPAIAVVILYCGDYSGRVLGSHLLQRPHPWPDLPALLAPAAALLWPEHERVIGQLLLAYLVLRTLAGIVAVLWPLRRHWRWANPAPVIQPGPVSA